MDQERVMNILLHDACALGWACAFRDDADELAPFFSHLDANSTIRALSWLSDPDIVSIAMLFIILLESQEIGVCEALLNVEGDRQRVERILADHLIVILHIDEEGLFIA